MLFTTPTQWVALAIALVAGWLLGLASAPGGRKWRTRYVSERDAHATLRKDQTARIAELERENERLRAEVPVAPVTGRPLATDAAARPLAADRAAAAYPGERRTI